MQNQEAYIRFNNNYTATIKSLACMVDHPLYLKHDVTSIEVVGFSDTSNISFKRDICALVQVHIDEILLPRWLHIDEIELATM